MVGKNEVETFRILLNEFFLLPNIKKTLKFIDSQNILGCERWLQIELLKFLCEHNLVSKDEVCKEESFFYDKRRKRDGAVLQKTDITFRIKNKQYYHAVELKQKGCLSLCDVKKDLIKIALTKSCHKSLFRKIFSLLIHPHIEQGLLERKLKAKDFQKYLEFSIKIPTTNLSCTVFSAPLL